MLTTLALLLAAIPPDLVNLDFSDGNLTGWKGNGFSLTTLAPGTPGVSSSDTGYKGNKGLLHRTFVVPPGAGTLHFSAFASVDDDNLNVYLEAAEREIVPKYVRTAKGFMKSPRLLPASGGKPREYVWSIADRVGETLRILVVDQSDEPGRHVCCSGFRLEGVDRFETREFSNLMNGLVREQKLQAMADPLRSKHFLAIGNTDEKFIRNQLDNCELMHQMFLNHFRVKGFTLKKPATVLMVAIFSSQEGFEAYIGHPVALGVTGLYHPGSNRLVVCDFGRSRSLVQTRKQIDERLRSLSPIDRAHQLGRIEREADEIRTDVNLATIMHEVAHQMSFNTGLLNRDGDLPLWLAEGLATYCEPVDKGSWKGIGEMNNERMKALRRAVKGQEKLLSLRDLVESDHWLHGPGASAQRILMGYAQGWALVRMLVEEQPKALKRYFELIYPRRTPEHRLADFAEVFGTDLARMEKRHQDYVKRLVESNP